MKLPKIAFILMVGGLVLAACASFRVAAQPAGNTSTAVSGEVQPVTPTAADLTRSDAQGNVTVEIKPENLSKPDSSLFFDVAINTHMVDLSMELAKLTTLSTTTGQTVQAKQWDAPQGGHHISGKLSFPTHINSKSILDGARNITLTIKDVDVSERVFTWQLTL